MPAPRRLSILSEVVWRGEPLLLPLVRFGTTGLRALERAIE